MYRVMNMGLCFALAALVCLAVPAFADVEWSVKKQLNLEAAPVDVATSPDGKWVFVLTQGAVLVYSSPDDKIVNRIPVDKGFDRVTFSEKDSLLILSSTKDKKLSLLKIENVFALDYTGRPFLGQANAPVTIAVFSDYQ